MMGNLNPILLINQKSIVGVWK